MLQEMQFKVGDMVVYPAHGLGKITGEEIQEIGNAKMEVFVISLIKDNMILRVPKKRALEIGLRQLSSKDSIAKMISTLQSKAKTTRGMWSRRSCEYEGKISSGDIISIAEVVRDLYKNIEDPDRSYSERVIYESALSRLSLELAIINGIEKEKAIAIIIDALKEDEEAA